MTRLTLRLPETLHTLLQTQSQREGVSLNQYIVYALTRQATQAYRIHVTPDQEVAQQHERFRALLESLRLATPAQVQKALARRELVEPEPELTAELTRKVQLRLAQQKAGNQTQHPQRASRARK